VRRFDITNRTDCCLERSVPLVVETSPDDKTWREVARRDAQFTTWGDSFPPDPAVRYLRVRVLRPSMLHLASVKIH
jgi:hypothetical protein